MNTCKTCKWWDWIHAKVSPSHPHGDASCDHDKMGHAATELSGDAASSIDAGTIYTGPDFGCIHHEAK